MNTTANTNSSVATSPTANPAIAQTTPNHLLVNPPNSESVTQTLIGENWKSVTGLISFLFLAVLGLIYYIYTSNNSKLSQEIQDLKQTTTDNIQNLEKKIIELEKNINRTNTNLTGRIDKIYETRKK